MPTKRNPSLEYTDEQLDNIVDRVVRGKYERVKPTLREVIATGLISRDHIEDYVQLRWYHQLTRAGRTMRINNLYSKFATYIRQIDDFDSPEAVWVVTSRYTGRPVCYTTGGSKGAVKWAETMFGWTMSPNERLDSRFVSLGGIDRAAILNMNLIPDIQERIQNEERKAKEALEKADKWRISLDALATVANHMAGNAIE